MNWEFWFSWKRRTIFYSNLAESDHLFCIHPTNRNLTLHYQGNGKKKSALAIHGIQLTHFSVPIYSAGLNYFWRCREEFQAPSKGPRYISVRKRNRQKLPRNCKESTRSVTYLSLNIIFSITMGGGGGGGRTRTDDGDTQIQFLVFQEMVTLSVCTEASYFYLPL